MIRFRRGAPGTRPGKPAPNFRTRSSAPIISGQDKRRFFVNTREALDREMEGMWEMDEERCAMEQEQHEASVAKAAPPGEQNTP
jgi:hypothetical protein